MLNRKSIEVGMTVKNKVSGRTGRVTRVDLHIGEGVSPDQERFSNMDYVKVVTVIGTGKRAGKTEETVWYALNLGEAD